jgi:hypothetical protein
MGAASDKVSSIGEHISQNPLLCCPECNACSTSTKDAEKKKTRTEKEIIQEASGQVESRMTK